MREQDDNRRPEEIEHDIERTRAEVSSTIDAIQSKLTPGQMMDQAFAYARTSLPADFGANLSNAIRDNPVPVALIGIGVGWLMMQGQNSDGRARMRRRASQYDAEYDSDSRVYATGYSSDMERSGSGEGRVHRVVSSVGSKGRDIGQGMKERVSEAKDRVSEVGHTISDKASELGSRVSNATSSMMGQARDSVQGTRQSLSGNAQEARARANQLGQRSQQQYYRAKDSVGRVIEEQPLILGVLGAAIGTLLGAALPSTRQEDRLMGSTRDNLMDSAKEMAREKADTLKESAQRVAQTAQQEIKTATSNASDTTASQGDGQAATSTSPSSSTTGRAGVADPSKLSDVQPGSQSLH